MVRTIRTHSAHKIIRTTLHVAPECARASHKQIKHIQFELYAPKSRRNPTHPTASDEAF